ncbi:small RNA 2'-O-methyltransferase-like [Elysia marginata]|uniref:Small RNA 2'-O-methyltransferase n=1 Tax=Elysia marginata TaxID=1093978 RepID=A0AAV4H2L0_9GAST|nr:small RNA 2'-O-methyltransferase-like [Elysia marginata]
MGDRDFKSEESSAGIHFVPPLYTQRYVLAINTLVEHNMQSVVDFGCSECGFLKLLPTAPCVEKVALVDIDRSVLVARKRQIYPELHHYLQRRSNPLHVSLYCGSAEDLDTRLQGFDAATLIEVIEHLHQDTLVRVTENVFGRLKPRLCFVTTPNSEFNVLFKNPDPTQFRHWDHKFEWTRSEFSSWCESVALRFGYNVKYTGVGQITSDPESARLGPCSQAAVFTLMPPTEPPWTLEVSRPRSSRQNVAQAKSGECYELIAEADYPYIQNVLSEEEKLDLEVSFCLRELVRLDDSDVAYGEELPVSITRIAEHRSVKALGDLEAVRSSLERQLYTLTPDRNHVLVGDEDSSSENDLEDAEQFYSQGEGESTHEKDSHTLSLSTLNDSGVDVRRTSQQEPAVEEENWDS